MSNSNLGTAKAAAGLAAALALVILAAPAWAADPVFPTGSRIGLVPPAGMVASDRFDGFADPAKDAAILITVLPAAAYTQIDKTIDVGVLKKQGVNLEKREPITLSFGKGFLLTGSQVADKTKYRKWLLVASASDFTAMITVQAPERDTVYSDKVVRDALATVAVRAKVPEAEEFELLPFSVGDLAGFRADDFLRGRAVMLGDAPQGDTKGASAKDANKDASAFEFNAHMMIAAIPGGPEEPDQRANFARLSFGEIGGIKDIAVTMSEPLRIGGQPGFQTMAQAKDAHTGEDVMVVQWLRFGGGGYLQMVGVARTDVWTATLARLRMVRDSVELK